MAVGLAERLGFLDVASLDGGLDAWLDAGLPTIGRLAATAKAPVGGTIVLPEPIDPAMLAKVLLEQPGSYAVIDLRPAWQFAEWHVPGAVNVTLADLGARRQARAGARVVLVDRDGSNAFAAAGALMANRQPRAARAARWHAALLPRDRARWRALRRQLDDAFGRTEPTGGHHNSNQPRRSAAPAADPRNP
jgi:rhodanese-related sulfurtransferase